MARLIAVADERKRDAQILVESAGSRAPWQFVGPDGRQVRSERFIKTTEGHTWDELLAACDDDAERVAQALVEGDPEIDLAMTGRALGEADRVWVRPDGSVLYSARLLKVVEDPSGNEIERTDFVDVEATVGEETPIPWSGRLFPIEQVVRRFALVRKLQLRHVNGLTFDFLYEIAKRLQDEGKMMLAGSGPRGTAPLIFTNNGSPYRGFLEGRVEGTAYRLVLHLSNLELKRVSAADDADGEG